MATFSDATTKEIIKKHGRVISSGMEVFEERNDFDTLPVSPAVDIALGGGLKEGSWVLLTGDPKTGKTTTALQIAANCQKDENGSRPIIYLDGEGRLKAMNLTGIDGLDRDKMRVVHSDEAPLSAEQFLDIAIKLISSKDFYRCVCIIDSTSSLIPERELTEDISGSFRAGLPKILASFCRKLSNVVTQQRATIIIITHFIANTSGYGKPRMPDCGRKIQYQADTRMEVKSIKPWDVGGKQIGQMINWRVLCSSLGANGTECQSWLKYGVGLDFAQELLNLGADLGLISKKGAWYSCDFMLEHQDTLSDLLKKNDVVETEEEIARFLKFQGQEKLYRFLDDNKAVLSLLEEDLKAML
tara:strand:- start:71286 stop:72356 length:1071 start_codon:yes stop_codon:yes gene_type:complete